MILPPIRHNDTPVELNLIMPANLILFVLQTYLQNNKADHEPLTTSRSVKNHRVMRMIREKEPDTDIDNSTSENYVNNLSNINYGESFVHHFWKKEADNLRRGVVVISIAGTWASGVIISNQGYVITNSHVIKPYVTNESDLPFNGTISSFSNLKIRVDYPSKRWIENIQLIFCSANIWDIAILKLPQEDNYPYLTLREPLEAMRKLEIGHPVLVIGHPLFSPSADVLPTVTSGILSKIVYHKGKEVMFQSTAPVHRGNSGLPSVYYR